MIEGNIMKESSRKLAIALAYVRPTNLARRSAQVYRVHAWVVAEIDPDCDLEDFISLAYATVRRPMEMVNDPMLELKRATAAYERAARDRRVYIQPNGLYGSTPIDPTVVARLEAARAACPAGVAELEAERVAWLEAHRVAS